MQMKSINHTDQPVSDYHLLTRLFFRLLPYQILLIVINAVNGIVDGLVASNVVGVEAMSAIGLYAPLTHFLYALSIMMVSGSQLLYGAYLGKQPESVHSVFSVDLLVSLGISLVTSLVMVLAAVTNVVSLSVDEVSQCAMFNRYLLAQAIGIPALVLGQQLFAFLSLENQTRRTMVAGIVCFATNAVGDLLFTAVIPLGTFGLGLASSVSVWVFFIIQLLYYTSGRSFLKYSWKACNWKDAPEIMRRGYSGALSRFVEMFRCLLVNGLILKYVGTEGLSSFSASNSFLGVIWAVPFGMIAVERMLMSIALGEEDRESLLNSMRVIVRRCFPIMAGIAAMIILAAVPLTRMFYHDPAEPVYQMTVMGFRLLPLCMPLAMISLGFACYAQAAQKKAMSVVLPVVDGFAGVSLTSLFLIPAMKMNGLYVANILNGVICIVVILIFSIVGTRRFPKNLEDLMLIPADFGPSADDRIDISVHSMKDVETVSQQVIDFCRRRGTDERRAFLSGLALEEMAGNVVKHGFTRGRKRPHSLDLRVIHRGDDIILRLRDDCAPFDPARRSLILEPESPEHNIGTRIVFRIARKVEYQNLLGCNVLTITV